MRTLIFATVAAAGLLSGGAVLTQPVHAAARCWWTGPVRHCVVAQPFSARPFYHPWWRYR